MHTTIAVQPPGLSVTAIVKRVVVTVVGLGVGLFLSAVILVTAFYGLAWIGFEIAAIVNPGH
jgi:hypothetical protein